MLTDNIEISMTFPPLLLYVLITLSGLLLATRALLVPTIPLWFALLPAAAWVLGTSLVITLVVVYMTVARFVE